MSGFVPRFESISGWKQSGIFQRSTENRPGNGARPAGHVARERFDLFHVFTEVWIWAISCWDSWLVLALGSYKNVKRKSLLIYSYWNPDVQFCASDNVCTCFQSFLSSTVKLSVMKCKFPVIKCKWNIHTRAVFGGFLLFLFRDWTFIFKHIFTLVQ